MRPDGNQPHDSTVPPATDPPPARSRRTLLTAALGGLAGAVAGALGRPTETRAAAGDNLVLGQTNYAGSSATRLNATSSGGAFWMTQYGSGSGVRGDSVNGHGGVFTTGHPERNGLYAQQVAAMEGNGAAVRGEGGANIGIYGVSDTYIGVRGYSATNTAVYGTSPTTGVSGSSPTGYGVSGSSTSSIGVLGTSTSGFGVYGFSTSSYAGYFTGTCYATAFTTTLSPTVWLDHPVAPARQVLAHATVISDEATTLYAGTVTTDAHGEATVTLPGYFGALNRDLRYQLTPLGSAMPALHVKSAVRGNRFTIAGATPGGDVCWQLTGVRADAYAKAHPLHVETKKTGREKGRYLTPLEHGQPESAGVDYELRQGIQQAPSAPPA